MKLLIHRGGKKFVRLVSTGGEEELLNTGSLTAAFWELATRFPQELIGWCEEEVEDQVNPEGWDQVFHQHLIMASYAVKTDYLPDRIGYIDQLPFANVDRKILYGTWRMSADVGGIRGEVLLKFRPLLGKITCFEELINSVGKLGQQNSLFCYSAPILIKETQFRELRATAGRKELFRFVYQHYNTAWVSVLFFCFLIFERSFPLFAYLGSFNAKKFFRRSIDLSEIPVVSTKKVTRTNNTIDVIIPTLGRTDYLYDVLKDLSRQSRLPTKVIIVEQNSNKGSESKLAFLKETQWPFELVHHFIQQTGVCNARNVALEGTTADWVFFADDDIRFEVHLLEEVLAELNKYGIPSITMNCRQPGETTYFKKVKQWGSFGSGTSVVKGEYARSCRFSPVFEHGYGEDVDYGMQLRQKGCDIVYHPSLEILHLKALEGGFRTPVKNEWEQEKPLPKPAPNMLALYLMRFSEFQVKGYRISLVLKNFSRKEVRNPFSYLQKMNKGWKKSREWAERLIAAEELKLRKSEVREQG